MKKAIKVYIYQNQEFYDEAQSIVEAAKKTDITPTQVRNVLYGLTKQPYTRQGFTYSFKPLTDEEIEKLAKMGYVGVDGNNCRKIVEKQEYEVNCKDGNVTYQAASKKKRIETFKRFLFSKFRERWFHMPKAHATLEKVYIMEFLDSIQ